MESLENYKDGELVGSSNYDYYENGQLSFSGHIKDGKFYQIDSDIPCSGNFKFYYDNGQLSCSGNFKDGEPDGLFKHYYENGQLESSRNYKDGKLIFWISTITLFRRTI